MFQAIAFPARALFVAMMIFSCFQTVYSQPPPPSDSMTAVLSAKESEMFAMISNGDKQLAEHLIGPDYITINADGTMEGKEATLKTMDKFKGSTAQLSEKQVRVYDNMGIINGRAKFYLKQMLVAEIFYTEIWHYRNQQWQFIGWQGTMTGLPSHYPVLFTILGMLLLFGIIRWIYKKRRK